MCGIAGIVRKQGLLHNDRNLVEAMTRSIAHRGPDGEGFFLDDKVALGHRRLSIIDVHEGSQPIYNEDGSVVVVFNGEIYNFKDLRRELESAGHRFKTKTDTEVIVHGWEQWGESCVEKFRGMFAFAIYDKSKGVLFIARDRLGIKPLYYSFPANGNFLFGSELKVLEQDSSLSRDINPNAVEEYFAYGYIPDPNTIYKSVHKLEPGHSLRMSLESGEVNKVQYWNFTNDDTKVNSISSTGEELIERLREAVNIRLVSDVPLGAFLSGGVDSSAVVALMSEMRQDPVKTTSIGFHEAEFDETQYAQMIVNRYGCDHTVEKVTTDDLIIMDDLVRLYDEPYADSSALPTYTLCKATRKNVTVALSGDGGDELFAGYRGFRLHMNKRRLADKVPLWVRKGVFGPLGDVYPKWDNLPKYLRAKTTLQTLALSEVDSYVWGSMITTQEDRRMLFSKAFLSDLQGYTGFEVARNIAKTAPELDTLRMAQYIDFKLYLPGDILTKVDRASMAHGLEVRVPILDHLFVEWCFGLPSDFKLRGGEGKFIFKNSLRSRVDEEILYRRKKGFSIPLVDWLKGPLRPLLDSCSRNGKAVELGIVDRQGFSKILNQFYSGKRDHSALLWSVLQFENFLSR